VAEVPMGTTLRTAIELAGGGIARGQQVLAVLVGVSSAVIVPEDLDVELTHEAMRAVGSGLGSAGFIVVGDDVEPVSLAAGASRFLAIESCGQCTHCKQDGGELADLLATMCAGNGDERTLRTIEARLRTVADGARCSLASQQQTVVGSILGRFGVEVRARVRTAAPAVDVQLITELVDIDRSGVTYDTTFPDKQPDWTYDAVDSGAAPAERLGDHRQQQQ
jgi:NADH:ubiquinone oxidoreductase subunit F (NADH-binding)